MKIIIKENHGNPHYNQYVGDIFLVTKVEVLKKKEEIIGKRYFIKAIPTKTPLNKDGSNRDSRAINTTGTYWLDSEVEEIGLSAVIKESR